MVRTGHSPNGGAPDGSVPPATDHRVPVPSRDPVRIRFRERMHGLVASGPTSEPLANLGGLDWREMALDAQTLIQDVEQFVRDPRHHIDLERGHVTAPHLGGRCPIVSGSIELMITGAESDERLMKYHVVFLDPSGEALTLLGFKDVRGRRFQPWFDTTRVMVEIYRGMIVDPDQRDEFPLIGLGILRIPLVTFLMQLATFRSEAASASDRALGLSKFMLFFSRELVMPYVMGLLHEARGEMRRRRDEDPVEDIHAQELRSRLDQAGRMLSESPPP